jgi:hypothetical protein
MTVIQTSEARRLIDPFGTFERSDLQTRPGSGHFGSIGVFVLAKHSSGRPVDQVNTSADVARHDLISAIRGFNAGVALYAKASIGAAV